MDFNRGQNDISKVPFMVDTADYHYFESVELDSKILRLPYKVSSNWFGSLPTANILISFAGTGRQIRHVHCVATKSGRNKPTGGQNW